ncbi:MAG: D-aminoacyl-tRNA deacylase [Candidatus ainarchaeum sp.]|nr:D-aminoacyl-tRNA deacylase [Candidatus ainarchaeum sp.]
MLKKFFIFSKEDCFSERVFNELKNEFTPELELVEKSKDYSLFSLNNSTEFIYFDEMHLNLDSSKHKILNQENAVYFFISKHKSKDGPGYFTVHFTGCYLKADFGGKDNTLSLALSELKDLFFENYNKNIKHFMEVTHHGPLFLRPHMYIEVGPDDASWANPDLLKAYISWIKPLFTKELELQNKQGAVLIGGSHYFDFEEIKKIEEKAKAGIGHIIPKYILTQMEDNGLLKKTIQEAITKTLNCKKIVINKSYVAKYSALLAVVSEINKDGRYEIITL